jgi:hypothetical protein
VDNEYIGVERRGFGFAKLWPLKPAIENCKNLTILSFRSLTRLESTEKQKYVIEKL